MHRHALTDEQWVRVQPHLPWRAQGRKSTRGDRLFVEAVIYRARTGIPWRDLPERFGPWQTVYDHFRNWRRGGVFDRIVEALQIKLDRNGHIDWEVWCIDGASVRAARAAGGAEKKVSRDTPTSRRTTHWAAAEAGLDRRSTWLLTATEFRSRPRSRPGK